MSVGRVAAFDERVDALLEPLRGTPLLDQVFHAASELGDFSLIWHLVNTARGTRSDRAANESLLFAVLLGAESLLVNQGIKRLFRRSRPAVAGDSRFRVRQPSTTSFPSGHASAAFFSATVLSCRDGRRCAPVWFSVATIVAVSRAYVRIHHASDVVAGAALGTVLGLLSRGVTRCTVADGT